MSPNDEAPTLVALRVSEGRRFASTVRALWDEGHAVLPISSRLPAPEIERILDVCRPGLLASGDERIALNDSQPAAPDTAVVLLTTGTTGIPKAVELSHGALRAAASASHRRLGVKPDDRWLCCLPLNHIAGFSMIVRSQLLDNEARFVDDFDPRAIGATDATLVSLVPTQLSRLLDDGVDLTRFRAVLLGGAALPDPLVERALQAGANIVRSYGMTETCGGMAYDGITLEGARVRIGLNSHVEVAGPMLMTCYRGQPELTQARLYDGWFDTRDVGEIVGGKLAILGRADDVINTGGEKVAPADVAGLLVEHPLVLDATVFGIADDEWGEKVVAVVVPGDGDIPTPDQLLEFLRTTTAYYKIPKDIYLTATIPRLPSGEADVEALKQLLQL